jgi:hypothetical protein
MTLQYRLPRLSESAVMESDARRYGYCNAETPPIIIVATSSGNTLNGLMSETVRDCK